jgi:DNA-binding Xre family transcriptional regulator
LKKVVVKLQSIMEKNGITSLVQLSEVTGIRRAALSAIANGKRDRIQLEHIERIAAALNIDDMNEIIGFE